MKRLKLEHADWHVTLRGARRLLLFHDDADYRTFYALLGEASQTTGMGLIADCLMSNHFHLGLSGGSEQLTRCMHRLNRGYSGYHNERYGLSGHAFEREYYCEPIPSDFILRRVVRYIHLNPVRAGKVAAPEDHLWSNYRRFISSRHQVLSGEEARVLGLFDEDLPRAQIQYREFVEKDLHRKVIQPAGRTPAWEIWQEQFLWILEYLRDRESDLAPLTPEPVAIYLGSRAGIPPRAMGKVLGHPNGRQASEILRRITKRMEREPLLISGIDRLNVL